MMFSYDANALSSEANDDARTSYAISVPSPAASAASARPSVLHSMDGSTAHEHEVSSCKRPWRASVIL
jgi:hypothetical protein